MSDHPMVQALHAAISRRSWTEVEQAANRIRDSRDIGWPPIEGKAIDKIATSISKSDPHCQTCGRTDREYSHTAWTCSDPWHADDHLRRTTAVSNGERDHG